MLKNLTYKKRLILLALAVVLFAIVAYKLAIRKTIELSSEYRQIKREIQNTQSVAVQIGKLKSKIDLYDKSIENSYSNQPVEVFILDFVAEYCKKNNILIKEFPPTHFYRSDNYIVETNKIILKGNFIPLLKLIYTMEQQYRIGKVSSVKFYKSYNNKKKINELFADIYIQTLKKVNHESE